MLSTASIKVVLIYDSIYKLCTLLHGRQCYQMSFILNRFIICNLHYSNFTLILIPKCFFNNGDYWRAYYNKLEHKLYNFINRKMFGDWEKIHSKASSIETFKPNSGIPGHNFIQIKKMFDVKSGYSLTLYTLILMLKTRQA